MSRVARAQFLTVCLLGALLAPAAPALAASITVDAGSADGVNEALDGPCSLREAVEAANGTPISDDCPAGSPGLDTITIPAGDVQLDLAVGGDVLITDDLVIQGGGTGVSGIEMMAGLGSNGFGIAPAATVTFTGLTLHGNPTFSAIFNEGDLTLDNVVVSGNSASVANGGGLISLGTLTVRNAAFENNSADLRGGAVYLDGGTATIEDSTFSGNSSGSEGGAVYMTGTDLTIRRTGFVGNSAVDTGGGLFADCACIGGSLLVEDSSFRLNQADGGGGASVLGAATFRRTVFRQNSAAGIGSGGGGLIADSFGEIVLLQETLFEGNEADWGGAISVGSTDLELLDSTLRLNHATIAGGGLDAVFSLVTIDGTTFSDNQAVDFGGGVNTQFTDTQVVNSTISGNTVTDPLGDGGGLYSSDGANYLLYATIAGNSAADSGGGVWTDVPADTVVDGSIVADNPGGDCSDPLTDEATNLDSDGSCFPGSVVGSITADPLLGALADNGGPTETHALGAGSPALNIGDPSSCATLGGVDQRGLSRASGAGCDLGAYELQAPPPPPKPKHTLTVSRSTGGTVTGNDLGIECGTKCSANLDQGKTGTLTAVPDDGREFLGWEGDCVTVDENECTVDMDGDRNVIATFSAPEGPPDPIATGRCKGMEPGSLKVLKDGTLMIAGTTGNDVLNGSAGPDVICGLAGNDTLKGKDQGDILLGDAGDDDLIGGRGPDRLDGGAGTDECLGGKDKDKLIACE